MNHKYIIFDTETTGLRWYDGHRPFLVGVYNGLDNTYRYINLRGESRSPYLASLLRSREIVKVGHNVKFDIHMMREAGYEVNPPYEDTQFLAHLHGQEITSLKHLAKELFGKDNSHEQKIKKFLEKEKRFRNNGRPCDCRLSPTTGKATRKPWDGCPWCQATGRLSSPMAGIEPNYSDVPHEDMLTYLQRDIEDTEDLYKKYYPPTQTMYPSQYKVECDVIEVLVAMEERGMSVNRGYFEKITPEWERQLEAIRNAIHRTVGHKFDISSPDQLREILSHMGFFHGLSCGDRCQHNKVCFGYTKAGLRSVDNAALSRFDRPIAQLIIKYRKLEKYISTYFKGTLERSRGRGTIHSSIKQNGARTGRFSSEKPNVQNIPKKDLVVRKGFIPHEGFIYLFADYAQVEARIIAGYSHESAMVEAFNAGLDPYSTISKYICGETLFAEHPKLRACGKELTLGISYGMWEKKLAKSLDKYITDIFGYNRPKGLPGPGKIISMYNDMFPNVGKFKDRIQAQSKRGYVVDVFGKRYYRHYRRPYQMVNYLVQGTATQVFKRAMIKVYNWIKSLPLDTVYLINIIHDEIMYEINKKYWESGKESAIGKIRECMEDYSTFPVPLTIDLEWSDTNWAEKKPVELKGVSSGG